LSLAPFVVVEGVDRVGKNTLAARLASRLTELGMKAGAFTTPDYGTASGRVLERLLRFPHPLLEDTSLILQGLMVANRFEVAARVEAARDAGRAAICVRWWPSAEIYGAADGEEVAQLGRASSRFLPEPDLYVLLDVRTEEIAERLDPANCYESSEALQCELAAQYRTMWRERARRDPRWMVCRMDPPGDEVAETRVAWRELYVRNLVEALVHKVGLLGQRLGETEHE